MTDKDAPDWAQDDAPDWAKEDAKPAKPAKRPPAVNAWESLKGAGQVAAGMGASALATPLIGAAGAVEATGKGLWRGAKAILGLGDQSVGEALDSGLQEGASTIRKGQSAVANVMPKNKEAHELEQAVPMPFEMASGKLGDIGEAAGGLVGPKTAAAGRTVGENAIDAAGAVMGAGALSKVLAGARALKPELSQQQEAIARAKQAGYTANPVDSAGGPVNTAMGVVANNSALDQLLANKNAANSTRLAKKAVGIPETAPLNESTIAPIRAKAEQAYAEVARAGDSMGVSFVPDAELQGALRNANRTLHDQQATYPEYYRNNPLEAVKSQIMNPAQPPTAGTVMKLARDLRHDAAQMLKSATLSPSDAKGAMAMKNVATTLEDFVDRKLSSIVATGGEATGAPPPLPMLGKPAPVPPAGLPGPGGQAALPGGPNRLPPPMGQAAEGVAPSAGATPAGPPPMGQMPPKDGGLMSRTGGASDLITKYRDARTMLAKLHDIESSANFETGHIDPAKLARNAGEGKMTGELADIVQGHRAMGHVVRGVEGRTANTGLRAGDASVGHALLHAAGEATAVPLAARHLMASDLYQKFMSNPSVSSLQQLKAVDPKLAMKAAAAISLSNVGKTNSTLPPKIELNGMADQ